MPVPGKLDAAERAFDHILQQRLAGFLFWFLIQDRGRARFVGIDFLRRFDVRGDQLARERWLLPQKRLANNEMRGHVATVRPKRFFV